MNGGYGSMWHYFFYNKGKLKGLVTKRAVSCTVCYLDRILKKTSILFTRTSKHQTRLSYQIYNSNSYIKWLISFDVNTEK